MITMPFTGCLGSGDDDSSLVGDWYIVSELIVEFREDGTYEATEDDESGTWSVDGNMLSITTNNYNATLEFTIDGGWFWILIVEDKEGADDDDKDCVGHSPDPITQDEWDELMNTMTFPSMCDGARIS